MSVAAMHWAWKHGRGTTTHRIVLLALADHAKDSGECWPGIKSIAGKTGTSRSTVKRAIRDLQCMGLLRIERRKRRNGSWSSNRYWLAIDTTDAGVGPK